MSPEIAQRGPAPDALHPSADPREASSRGPREGRVCVSWGRAEDFEEDFYNGVGRVAKMKRVRVAIRVTRRLGKF